MKLTLNILLLLFVSLSGLHAQNWSDVHYKQYTFRTFVKYAPAQQEIDFKNIDYELLSAAIYYATNYHRYQNGRSRLKYHPALRKAASMHSKDMVMFRFFSHHSPLPQKGSFINRCNFVGLQIRSGGENIADGFGLRCKANTGITTCKGQLCNFSTGKPLKVHSYISYANAVLQQWMNSPGHRANILNSDYQYVGCGGFAYSEDMLGHPFYRMKATQNFSGAIQNM